VRYDHIARCPSPAWRQRSELTAVHRQFVGDAVEQRVTVVQATDNKLITEKKLTTDNHRDLGMHD